MNEWIGKERKTVSDYNQPCFINCAVWGMAMGIGEIGQKKKKGEHEGVFKCLRSCILEETADMTFIAPGDRIRAKM